MNANRSHPNRILAGVSPSDFNRLRPHLEPLELKFRQLLQASNRKITHIYFLDSGLASVVAIGRGERRKAEVALVGREGMTGIPVILGTDRSPCDVFMQIEGKGQRIAADALKEAIDRSPDLLRCLLRYAHAFQMQAHYTALANAQGTIEQRLARWILMAQDRVEGDTLPLTHEFLALMLGARRASVTLAIRGMTRKLMIGSTRGAVTILNRGALEECADGLYGVPEAEFDRLFGNREGE